MIFSSPTGRFRKDIQIFTHNGVPASLVITIGNKIFAVHKLISEVQLQKWPLPQSINVTVIAPGGIPRAQSLP